jgi:alpha-glucosidase
VLRFWFDPGVDGFRIDVAHGLIKDAALRDWDGDAYNTHSWNQPEVHDIYRRWRAPSPTGTGPLRELTFVGEIWVPEVDDLARYLRPNKLPQVFFDLLVQRWDATSFRVSVDRAFDEVDSTSATITWTLANHDVHRAVTRYGLTPGLPLTGRRSDGGPHAASRGLRRRVRASAARRRCCCRSPLPGSDYLYQGEELGLPGSSTCPTTAGRTRSGPAGEVPSTGGTAAASPCHGHAAAPRSGSPRRRRGPGVAAQPDWFAKYAVAEQDADAGSTLALHRTALRLRRQLTTRMGGDLRWLPTAGHTCWR